VNHDLRSLKERLLGLVVEDAPTSAVDEAVSAFGGRRTAAIDRIVALLVSAPGTDLGIAGARGVDTAAGKHLLYSAAPHDLALSVYDDDGWRLIGQLLVDPASPSPTVVEVEVGDHRAATRIDPDTGEFEFDGTPAGQARLVFIGAEAEIVVESIPLDRES